MTIKEKSERIEKWCDSKTGAVCRKCILYGRPACFIFTDETEERVVAENYNIIFGDDGTEKNPADRTAGDSVNHPAHYQGKNECIDVMIAMFGREAVKHFCMCNAYKYRFRAAAKGGDEDIKKAEWYESKLMELGGRDES